MSSEQAFIPFREKMAAAGLSSAHIERFWNDYRRCWANRQGKSANYLRESELTAVEQLVSTDQLRNEQSELLSQVVVLKLNGGLGTTMGLDGPKGVIVVREGLSFLDITLRQLDYFRQQTNVSIPLILMNSYSTDGPSLDVLARHGLKQQVPCSFLQSRVPKIQHLDLGVATRPSKPILEWCPPGHGEIYHALCYSGLYQKLLDKGYRYLFVSNVDNLGATLCPQILTYFAQAGLDFLMEVTRRTADDKKGGHLARCSNSGRLKLRESAQCHPDDLSFFQDIELHRFFNTNNLWVRLEAVDAIKDRPLPLIENVKPIDPTEPSSPKVIQLETAMGAAIEIFPKAEALEVARKRFVPVKSTGDFLRLSSDLYALNEKYLLEYQGPGQPPRISLDSRYYGLLPQMLERFPESASLLECSSLTIEGDINFGERPVFKGDVHLRQP